MQQGGGPKVRGYLQRQNLRPGSNASTIHLSRLHLFKPEGQKDAPRMSIIKKTAPHLQDAAFFMFYLKSSLLSSLCLFAKSITCSLAELFFYADKLVVLSHTVCTAHRTSLNLT